MVNLLVNGTVLVVFIGFYMYIKKVSDEAHFFTFLFVLPFMHFILDIRRRVIVEKGYLRYVNGFRGQEVLLNDVAYIHATSGGASKSSHDILKVKDKEEYTILTIPKKVLLKKDYKRFAEAVKESNPNIKVDFSYFEALGNFLFK